MKDLQNHKVSYVEAGDGCHICSVRGSSSSLLEEEYLSSVVESIILGKLPYFKSHRIFLLSGAILFV